MIHEVGTHDLAPRPEAVPQPLRGRIYKRGECDYSSVSGANISTLLEMRRSAKHYQHRLQHPRKSTSSMALGTTAHTAVLEPEQFLRCYAMWQATDEETGKTRQRRGKAWEAFQAQHAGKTIVRDKEYDEATRIARAIRSDRTAMRYLAMGEPEVTLTWTDQATGIDCKGRVDWVTDIGGTPFIVDLKTTRDGALWAFAKDFAKLSYHVRLAFYADGYEAATGRAPGVAVVAVESTAPHDVVTYIIPPDVLETGRIIYGRILERLQECRSSDTWPGVGGGAEKILQLPAWATPEAEEEDIQIRWDE